MKRTTIIALAIAVIVFVVGVPYAYISLQPKSPPEQLTVYAAASLTGVMQNISSAFSAKYNARSPMMAKMLDV